MSVQEKTSHLQLAKTDLPLPDPELWPRHVAIIMDGNGRWAKQKLLPRGMGHREGGKALRKLVEYCAASPVEVLTVYAFSSENWQRPQHEVNDLMELLCEYLDKELSALHDHNIRLAFIGNRQTLSDEIQSRLSAAEYLTQINTELTLVVALSYGGREEITRAARQLAERVSQGELTVEAISEATFEAELDTRYWAQPDLLIRTGGEKRLSNFLLWQAAYSELYFCDTLWPNFTPQALEEAVRCYAGRERRFGQIEAL